MLAGKEVGVRVGNEDGEGVFVGEGLWVGDKLKFPDEEPDELAVGTAVGDPVGVNV